MDARKARHAGGDRRRCAAGTFASDYDTTLSVYTGRPGSLTQIACNDDSGDLQSRVRFSTVAGTTYFVMAGSSDATPGGMLQLTMEELPPAVVLGISLAGSATVDRDGLARVSGTVTCSRPVPVVVFGSLRQEASGRVALGYFRSTVDCTGSASWSATVLGTTGTFCVGQARLAATASFDDPIRLERKTAVASRTVPLRSLHVPMCAAATRFGTTMRHASITSSRISASSIAASQTRTQLYRSSERIGR